MGSVEDLIAFLNARYDGQAADHWQVRDHCMQCGEDWPCYPMRDIEAKRRILGIHGCSTPDPCDAHDAESRTIPCDTLLLLASPYVGHRDYREGWRP